MPTKSNTKGKKQKDFSALDGKYYSKSNTLVNAKGNSSLLTQKLFALGIQQAEIDEKTGILSSTIYGTDLRKMFGNSNGSFYEKIKEATIQVQGQPSLLDYRLVYANDASETIEAINVITDCKFEGGVLTMRYNTKVNNDIYRLKANYTTYALSEIMPLNSKYSLRLYEILKAEYDRQSYIAHKTGRTNDGKAYVMEINLTDLKLRLGIIDPSIDKKILNAVQAENPDYNLIEELAMTQKDGRKYKKASNLKANVLDKACEELAEKTNLSFEYEDVKAGQGGKIIGLRFFIRYNNSKKSDAEGEETSTGLSENEREAVIDEIFDYIDEKVKPKDLKAIAEAAGYDFEKVKKQYDIAKKKKKAVPDIVGYLIRAIKEDYSEPVPMKNGFTNFEQNVYDFEDLEKRLLDN